MESWFKANMEMLLFSERFHDVVFTFRNGEKIFAHTVILSVSSDVFSAQLNGPLREPNINIRDSDAATFRVFLRCMYTGQLYVNLDNMFDLAQLGQKYNIPHIVKKVSSFFEEKLKDESNLCKLFCLEKMEVLEDSTRDTFWKLLLNRLARSLYKPEFLTFNSEQVGELVRSDDLAVHEFDLYKAVVRWAQNKCLQQNVEATCANMRKHVKSFIHDLRIPTLSHGELLLADGICKNNLLYQTEKQSLFLFCAGETSTKLPFEVQPRQKSLDLIVAAAKSEETGTVVGAPHSTFFVPKGNFRFVGLSFTIDVTFPEDTKIFPVNVDFELKSVSADGDASEPVCSFSYVASWTLKKKNHTVYCRAGSLFPLYANQKYELVSRCGPGVRMQAYTGRYERRSGKGGLHNWKNGAVHAVESFTLLRA